MIKMNNNDDLPNSKMVIFQRATLKNRYRSKIISRKVFKLP